jgi:hypothetical protein
MKKNKEELGLSVKTFLLIFYNEKTVDKLLKQISVLMSEEPEGHATSIPSGFGPPWPKSTDEEL